MRHCAGHYGSRKTAFWQGFGIVLAAALLAGPPRAQATTCITQGEMNPQDRGTLASAGQQLGNAVIQQDFSSIQGTLLPAVAQQWEGIRGVIEQGGAYIKGGQVQLNAMYLLDATSLTAPADTQFFCSNANGSMTVTVSMHSLPPGKYAVILAYVLGAATPGQSPSATVGQLGFILGLEGNSWKLGGVFLRPGVLEGHDGVWWWQRARELTSKTLRGPLISLTTPRDICSCRWTSSRRPTWKSWGRSRPRSRNLLRKHFLTRCRTAPARGRSIRCISTLRCARRTLR